MLAKQEKISKLFLPSSEGNMHPIENEIISMDPNTPRCQDHNFHITIKLKEPFTILYQLCNRQGEVLDDMQRCPTKLSKLTIKERVLHSFLHSMTTQDTLHIWNIESFASQ
jgi:hypothetical protein